MSNNNKTVWSEGMFLQPQHFQQHDRYWQQQLQGRTAPLVGFSWGFVQLELDNSALALGKIVISQARGIFPDGTPFDFPGNDAAPLPLDIGGDAKDELIFLALPLQRAGADEAVGGAAQEASLARFAVDENTVRDSNAGADNAALIQVGQLRLRLLRASDVTDAYTTLGIAKVIERRADNQLLLHKTYTPPTLHAGLNANLGGYLRELYGLLHQRGETLALRMSQPGRGGSAEIIDFLLLQTVNRYAPLFAHLQTLPLLHPERLFSICLELAGDLATLARSNRRPALFPTYNHDALEQTFTPLLADLRQSLSMVLEQSAIAIELQDRKYGVRVATIADLELFKSAGFVLAVNAQMPSETLRKHFRAQVKIGPADRIRDLVNAQLPGIPLEPLPVAPRQIPYHAGFTYFELQRGGELWQQLERSGALAMHIAGEFPGLELEFWAIRE